MARPNFYSASGVQITNRDAPDDDRNKDFVYFEGKISTGKRDTKYHEMQPTALRQFAKAANDVIVLPEHSALKQPIGRSVQGRYSRSEDATYSRFYIQSGLSTPSSGYGDTDSYIAALKAGTSRDLSIGAFIKKQTCSLCDEPMERKTNIFFTITECTNGHVPGQRVYIDRDGVEYKEDGRGRTERIITAKIHDAELIEFSSVAFGANPDTEVTKDLKQALDADIIQDVHLIQLTDAWGKELSEIQDLLGRIEPIRSKPPSVTVTKGGKTMATEKDQEKLETELAHSVQVIERNEQRINELIEERDTLQGEVDELKSTHLETETITEERDQLLTELNEAKEKLLTLQNSEYKCKMYDKFVELEAADTVEWFCRAEGTDVEKKQRDALYEELVETNSIDIIRRHKRAYVLDARSRNKKDGDKVIDYTPKPDNYDARRHQ